MEIDINFHTQYCTYTLRKIADVYLTKVRFMAVCHFVDVITLENRKKKKNGNLIAIASFLRNE